MKRILILILLFLPVLAFSQVKIDSIDQATLSGTSKFPTIDGPDGAKRWKYFDGDQVREFTAADIIDRAYVPDTTGSHAITADFGNFIRSTVDDNNIYYCDYDGNCRIITTGSTSISSGNVSGRTLQTLTADGTDTLDFAGNSLDYWQIDLSSTNNSTINFVNPGTEVASNYVIHFLNASSDTINFANTVLDANGDTIAQHIFEQGQIIPIYYDDGDYYTNYIELATSSGGSGDSGVTITEGAPTDNSDPAGTLRYDDNNLYVKTASGWGSTSLTAYNPLQLSYDTSIVLYHLQNSGISEASALVSQWNDLSGNGNHSTASGGTRPSVDANGNIVFTGGQYFELSDYLVSDLTDFTVIVVAQSDQTSTTVGKIIDYNDRTDDIYWGINTYGHTVDSIRWQIAGSNYTPIVSQLDTTDQRNTDFLISAIYEESDTNFYRINGVETVVLEPTTTFADVGFAGGKKIGAYSTGAGEYFEGLIKLIVIYDRKLSSSEIEQVESEINDYFSIY